MNPATGEYMEISGPKPDGWVEVRGTPEQVAQLADNVRRGAKRKRKAQRKARKRNR